MTNPSTEPTFNDMPRVMSEMRQDMAVIKRYLFEHIPMAPTKKENLHVPMTADEASDYLKIPKRTLYEKVRQGIVPASKTGKRYVFYHDELDKWLEVNRKNPVPMTNEEMNAAILASNKRKPSKRALAYAGE